MTAGGTAGGDVVHRVLLDLIGSPVAVLTPVRDEDGTVTDLAVRYANRAVDALFPPGPGPAGVTGRLVLDLWPSLRDTRTFHQLAAVADGAPPWSFRLRTAGFGVVPEWVEGVAQHLSGDVLVWLRDVSEVQQGRLDLDRAQNAYRVLLDALPDRIVAVYDEELRVRLIAGRSFAGRGVDPDAVVGTPVLDLVPEARRIEGLETRLRAALEGERQTVSQATSRSGRVWRLDVAPLGDPGPDGAPSKAAMVVALDISQEVRGRQERDRTLWELQEAQRVARTGSWTWDARTDEMWRSPEQRRMSDRPPDGPEPPLQEALAWLQRQGAETRPLVRAWRRMVAEHEPFEVEVELRPPDGEVRHLVIRAEPLVDEGGGLSGARGTMQDVTEAYRARQALAESEERFRLAFDESPIGKALLSPPPHDAGRVLRANEALCRLLGRPAEEVVGTVLWDWVHPDDRDAARAAAPGERAEVRLTTGGGRRRWAGLGATAVRDRNGRALYLLAQIEDVTARREAESELVRQARFDPLTGLPNRASLIDHLAQLLAAGGPVAVFFLDLDDFKTVNDSLGHAAGDVLLERVAAQIERSLRGGDDFATRWGGDEFVVVSAGDGDPGRARALADRLRLAVSEPVNIDDHEVSATASVGVAIGATASTAEGLLRDADIAMYRAKAGGKDRCAMADSAGHAGAMRRLTLASALRRALDQDQLCLHYQPVVDLVSGRIASVEALLRWHHPERGMLGPAEFLDVAESSAFIVPLGAWALRTAAFQAMQWYRRFGDRAPTVAVNVSVRQLGHGLLHERVADALRDSGLAPSRLCVELTEREAVAASGAEAADLQAVHTSGVQLAVDDFGTGYAGLDYLRRFPVDILKIDQSFVRGLGDDPTDTAIVVGLITLGKALDLTVVAEGVEDEAQLGMLRRLECPQGQGRLWSPPVGPERIIELLAASVSGAQAPGLVVVPGGLTHEG